VSTHKPVESSGTTGELSTGWSRRAELLSVRAFQPARGHTGFAARKQLKEKGKMRFSTERSVLY